MFLGYVGAIVGGISLAAVLLVISKTFRLKLPGWIYPAAAGIGMISLTIYTEHTWFSRTAAQLPPEVEVIQVFEESMVYRPWTYVFPLIERFVAVDHTSTRQNEAAENIALVDVFLMERMSPVLVATQFVDCTQGARLLMDGDTVLDDDGLPTGENWVELGLDDPLVTSVCGRLSLGSVPPATATEG